MLCKHLLVGGSGINCTFVSIFLSLDILTTMETNTYSSNSANAVLKDNGPYRITSADNSVKGQTVYQYQTQSSTTIVGNRTVPIGIIGKTKPNLIKLL